MNLNLVMPSGRRTIEGGACSSDMGSRQILAAPQKTPARDVEKLQKPRQNPSQKPSQEPSQPDRKPAGDKHNQKLSRKTHAREQDGANENVRQSLPVHPQGSARAGVGGGAGRGGPGQCSKQKRQRSGIQQTGPSVGSSLGKIHQFTTIAGKNGRYPMLWTTQLSTILEAWLGTPYMLASVRGPAHRASNRLARGHQASRTA